MWFNLEEKNNNKEHFKKVLMLCQRCVTTLPTGQLSCLCYLCLSLTATQYKEFADSNQVDRSDFFKKKLHAMFRQIAQDMVIKKISCDEKGYQALCIYNDNDPCRKCCKLVLKTFGPLSEDVGIHVLNLLARWFCIHGKNADFFIFIQHSHLLNKIRPERKKQT